MDTHLLILGNDSRYTFSKKAKDGLHYVDGTDYAEAIKGSHKRNVVVEYAEVTGGHEDCIDLVGCSEVVLADLTLIPSRKTRTFITMKGGNRGILLKRIRFRGKCRWPWDISIGDHTIYGWREDRMIVIESCSTEKGRPLTVLCLAARRPMIVTPKCPVRVIMVPKFLVRIHFWLNDLRIKLFGRES